MNNQYSPILFFLGNVIFLFLVSRITIQELFRFVRLCSQEKTVIYTLISLIFLPGTIIHEIAHYFTATILFLKVREVRILPQWEDNHIKLGSVIYEKKDFLRGMLIGLAPIFGGFIIFLLFSVYKIFPNSNIFINIILIYIIFTISTTMFSSSQDLKELVNTIPFIIFVAIGFYLLNIQVDSKFFVNKEIIKTVNNINLYLFYSLIINIVIILFMRLVKKLFFK